MLIIRYLQFTISVILLSVFMSACNREPKIKEVKATVIDYHVDYMAEKAGSIPTSILPRKMELIFSEPYALNHIEGLMGQFSLTYIANLNKKTVITLLKIFDKKYYHKGKAGEMPVGIDQFENMSISKGSAVREIAGFDSEELILRIPGKNDVSMYSTKELNIKSPNITTPYRQEEEVLLIFYTSLSNMEMILTAQDYREVSVSNEIFQVPADHRRISKESMEEAIRELFK